MSASQDNNAAVAMDPPASGAALEAPAAEAQAASAAFHRIDAWIERGSDWLNPILVKEVRQAIKSKQFAIWLVLLLASSWMITIGGVAVVGPSIHYLSAGGYLLYFYFFALALPLTLVVPLATFASLASERGENTRDLIEVTTLRPGQIVRGKLASAAAQMAVYLATLAPCVAFTYLLRGVDITTIVLVLLAAVMACMGLSQLALLMSAASNARGKPVVSNVLMIGISLGALSGLMTFAGLLLAAGPAERASEFWLAMAMLASAYLTTFGVAYTATVSLLDFPGSNRSTSIRIALFVQQAVYVAWAAAIAFESASRRQSSWSDVFLGALLTAPFLYWTAIGAMLVGEQGAISARVRRTLPKTFFGKVIFSWFQPGPAAGYVFAVANFSFLAAAGAATVWLDPLTNAPRIPVTAAAAVLVAYLAGYLGIGRLAVASLRRLAPLGIVGAMLVQFLILLAGNSAPYIVETLTERVRLPAFVLVRALSPLWTIQNYLESGVNPFEEPTIMLVVCSFGLAVFMVNLAMAGAETRNTHLALPRRVVEDDRELTGEAERVTNPWGDRAPQAPLPGDSAMESPAAPG